MFLLVFFCVASYVLSFLFLRFSENEFDLSDVAPPFGLLLRVSPRPQEPLFPSLPSPRPRRGHRLIRPPRSAPRPSLSVVSFQMAPRHHFPVAIGRPPVLRYSCRLATSPSVAQGPRVSLAARKTTSISLASPPGVLRS